MPDKLAGYEIHPAANLFPMLTEPEMAELAADIKANGLRFSLVRYEGKILDGRNRLVACERAGVKPQFVDWPGSGSPTAWVLSVNLRRRHLDQAQRAMVAARAKTAFEEEARKRQKQGASPPGGVTANLRTFVGKTEPQKPGERLPTTAQLAAKSLNVSPRSVDNATRVLRDGAPELAAGVEAGKVAVSTAATLAELPKEEQKAILELGEKLGGQLGEKAILEKAREINQRKKQERLQQRTEKLAEIAKGNAPLPAGQTASKYPIIYADPPWEYEKGTTDPTREIANQYPPMPLADICALKVADLTTPDAVLFMWATNPLLPEAFEVLKAWGFTYKTNIAWDKEYGEMGYWVRSRHELLLIATRGNPPTPPTAERPVSVQHIRKDSEHSRKPDEFYALIERAYPTLPKIELFAKHPPNGWARWGNQAPPQIEQGGAP